MISSLEHPIQEHVLTGPEKTTAKRSPDSNKKDMILTYRLCLVIRQISLGEGASGEKWRMALKAAGWSILELAPQGSVP